MKNETSEESLELKQAYQKGYADAMNWKTANHLEHLPASQQQHNLKLMPREATREMLEAMDECSMEGYDEHLYAGHAASVYMAAWDAFQPQYNEQKPIAWMHNFIDGVVIPHRPNDIDRNPHRWTALYAEPKPCPTCEALARTVMMDQTGRDV